MEYTQEQVDKMVAEAVSKAKEGLYTKEDFDRKLTAEVDRRVETGIQKGLDTYKSKWEQEFQKKASMTAEELAQQKLQEEMKNIKSKESEITKRANLLDARDMLSGKVPKDYYDKFLNVLVTEDGDTTKQNVENFIDMFNSAKSDIEKNLKKEFTNVTPPGEGGDKVVSKKDFNTMSYMQKLEFKKNNPEQYKEFVSK